MPSEIANISDQFVHFFRRRREPSLENKKNIQLKRPGGWFEELRIETFGTPNSGTVLIKEGDDWSKLRAKVYTIHSIGQISAVLAYYSDGTILWLDDHSSDDDFEVFVRNERLWTWLPDQRERLVRLLVETKLNYLGRPYLVNGVSDIPSFSTQDLELWPDNLDAQEQLIDAQKRLEYVSEKIIPSTVSTGDKTVFELAFFVWTKIMGRIVRVQFKFGQDGFFQYEGDELVKLVGRFIIPR